MSIRPLPFLLLFALLAGCDDTSQAPLLGTLEWDRIGLPAEASETILAWRVNEGDRVQAGQLLLELDPRRLDARLLEAKGDVAQVQARLEELNNGARTETVDAARASLNRNRAALVDAERTYQRIEALYQRRQVAIAELDRARATRDQARAAVSNTDAQLRELTNGTRPEQIEQATALLQASQGRLAQLEVSREHLSLRAPRTGRVDALPFKPGDQPPQNAELVSLLVGEAPYARVYIPASVRPHFTIGDRLRVQVEGVGDAFDARIRSIASESSFTPYFALTGDDASRLVYRAELLLEGEAARQLPAGLPVQAMVPENEQR
ncbi:HlyD family secretion protein [Metapseudomonas boanensis]|uniref:HlyD family efflux transporter periplasmic adaptor subunit n=1 Tax=Metapseudomonas boanensis TaxID=2822138 RepID=A0ABS5XAG6_9GAMM|nr:HlyD family efflux transporter periplasmic adaptor subunit [Pseudomonas boanensis]MBT8764673.1 HlyD family efflux transporter periplasmic adaptor subunit [Pseudomonas boanensis]